MTNNYLKVLLHLKQFEGDGSYHPIEEVLGNIKLAQKEAILRELEKEQFINLVGREEQYLSYVFERNVLTGQSRMVEDPLNDIIKNTPQQPFRAKITFKGSKYLKEELQMQKSGVYNINISGDSAKHTVVLESSQVTIYNQDEAKKQIDQIIDTITSDNSIAQELKQTSVAEFQQLKTELERGNVPKTINKVLSYGDQIGSIAGFMLALAQAVLKP